MDANRNQIQQVIIATGTGYGYVNDHYPVSNSPVDYLVGKFSQVVSDAGDGTTIRLYENFQPTSTYITISGTVAPYANNVVVVVYDGASGTFHFNLFSQGYSGGSGNGTSGEVNHILAPISGRICLAGSFSGAGGYTNNGRFAVYYESSNGWGDYFYYPSSVNPSSALISTIQDNGNGSVTVTGSGISSFTDQYGTHSGSSTATWWITSRYWTNIQ